MTTRLSDIKLEGNELQTYLDNFNKDLEGTGPQTITLIQTSTGDNDADDDEEEGTYFVDQSGNYYYQATKDSEPVLAEPPDGENIQFIVEEEDENSVENADNLDHESITDQVNTNMTKSRKQTVVSTKNEDFDASVYETQGEHNENEVSYVYIMDDKDGDENDGTQEELVADDGGEEKVYEFDEDEEEIEVRHVNVFFKECFF